MIVKGIKLVSKVQQEVKFSLMMRTEKLLLTVLDIFSQIQRIFKRACIDLNLSCRY